MQVYRPVVLSSFCHIPIQIVGSHTKHKTVNDVRIMQTKCFVPVTAFLLSIDKDPFDIHGSVHRRWLSRNTNNMQLCNRTYYSKVY